MLLDASSETPPVDLIATFPYLCDDKMSEREKNRNLMKLSKNTSALQSRFASLVFDLKRSVQKSCQVEDIKYLLSSRQKHFEKLLLGCITVSDVFIKASPFWSFFNLGIIKLLTRKLGTERDKKKLELYLEKYRLYAEKRMVCECPNNAFGVEEKSEECFGIKTDKSMDSFTLDELQDMEFELNKILGRELLRLLSIEEGCVRLIYRTLSDDVMDLSTYQQMELRKIGVLQISYGDRLMDMPELEVNDIAGSSELHDKSKSKYSYVIV